MAIQTFSPTMVSHFQELKTALFKGDAELAALRVRDPSKGLFYSRFEITWIFLTAPLRIIHYLFLKVFACGFDLTFIRSIAKPMHVRANRVLKPIKIAWGYLLYGNRLLRPTFYEYKPELFDVYALRSIPRGSISNPTIKKSLHSKLKAINFDRIGKGLCHGSVSWFNFLFLRAQKDRTICAKAQSLSALLHK